MNVKCEKIFFHFFCKDDDFSKSLVDILYTEMNDTATTDNDNGAFISVPRVVKLPTLPTNLRTVAELHNTIRL